MNIRILFPVIGLAVCAIVLGTYLGSTMIPPKPPGEKANGPEASLLWQSRTCGTADRTCRVAVERPGEVSMVGEGKVYEVGGSSLIFGQSSLLGCTVESPCRLMSQVTTGTDRDYTRYTITNDSGALRTIHYEGLHISLE